MTIMIILQLYDFNILKKHGIFFFIILETIYTYLRLIFEKNVHLSGVTPFYGTYQNNQENWKN